MLVVNISRKWFNCNIAAEGKIDILCLPQKWTIIDITVVWEYLEDMKFSLYSWLASNRKNIIRKIVYCYTVH